MSITLKKDNVNLEASFEKLKELLKQSEATRKRGHPGTAWSILASAVDQHIEECTTSDDLPADLFTRLGNALNPE